MTTTHRLFRLLIGVVVLIALLTILFAVTSTAIPRWGASDTELIRSLPGDELAKNPVIRWTNAITINTAPEHVWPWIAQLGDTRGDFYSYTFIENRVGIFTGDPSYNIVYRNANKLMSEWQGPDRGTSLIQGLLQVEKVEPGKWLLGSSVNPNTMRWVWLWYVEPTSTPNHTRLINRFMVEVPNGQSNLIMTTLLTFGGFIMQQNMLQGIQTRAEGGSEPDWTEPVEIGLWFVPLLCGLVAAVLFVWCRSWWQPLLVAMLAVIALFVLTFVQPLLAWRAIVDILLLVGLYVAWRSNVMQDQERERTRQE